MAPSSFILEHLLKWSGAGGIPSRRVFIKSSSERDKSLLNFFSYPIVELLFVDNALPQRVPAPCAG